MKLLRQKFSLHYAYVPMSFFTLTQEKHSAPVNGKSLYLGNRSQLLIPHIPKAFNLRVSFLLISLIYPSLLDLFYKLITSFDVWKINPLINQSTTSVNKHKPFRYSSCSITFSFLCYLFQKRKIKEKTQLLKEWFIFSDSNPYPYICILT